MAIRDDFRWWALALEGRAPDPVEGEPQPGYYKLSVSREAPAKAVAIWTENGRLVARVDMTFEDPATIWGKVCRSPIRYEDYQHYRATGTWKDHPATADGVLTRDLGKAAPIY